MPSVGKSLSDGQSKDSGTDLIVVGIGASAGGLEALRVLVAGLPLKSNIAYIIAQHMSPHHRSMMVELLARETRLPVFEVKNKMRIQADTIYVAAPNSDVLVKGGKLQIRKPLADLGAKPSIDYLFTSMAEDLGERAIGVILSGTGSDGSHGILAINSAGGISIAQDPKTAKYDSMPIGAIKAGAELILPPEEIASQLVNIIARPRIEMPDMDKPDKEESPLENLVKHIYQKTKMDFSNYKEATIKRQIERRMAILQIKDLNRYVKIAKSTDTELKALANNFLICVTSFFRDSEPFDLFREHLRLILRNKKEGDHIRVWVPGCATGEEAYSIAIIIAEELSDKIEQYKIQIFATDANPETTKIGRRGIYPETSVESVLPEVLAKYFIQKDRFFQVDRRIRDMVVFATQDLVQDPPFVRVDAISCRNLLIYFKPGLQDKVFRIFHYALNPDGLLLLGKSESIVQSKGFFLEIDRKQKLFRKNNVSSSLPDSRFAGAPVLLASRSESKVSVKKENILSPAESSKNTLFNIYTPPSVVITGNGDIMEIFGDIGPFTHINEGKPDFSFFAMVHSPLRTELRAIVQKVIKSGETTYTHPVTFKVDGEKKAYRTVVRPLEYSSSTSDVVVISFEAMVSQLPKSVPLESIDEVAEARIAELGHELTITRESLQTVIEELETSNEELQSLNEEAQAANEELQASNEELETTNEELQATNEELTTVNDELTTKSTQLSEALSDMEAIQNSSERAILVVDKDLNIRRKNKKSAYFFKMDLDANHLNLSSIPFLFQTESFIDKVHEANKTGKSFSVEFARDDNYYSLKIFPYLSEKKEFNEGVVITIDDITEIVRAKNEAQRANRAKTEFLASMSHELRTPLNAILGFTQLFGVSSDNPLTQEQDNYLKLIRTGGEHLLTLINGILNLSKIESGSIPVSMDAIEPFEVISSALLLAKEMIRSRNPKIKLKNYADCPQCSEPCAIFADQNRFRQVLINLLSNAIKYNNEDGNVTIQCLQTEGHNMRFVVSDTGPGISEKYQKELFQPFHRLGAEGSKIEGSGIGLTITKRLMDLMNGNVGYTTAEGKGSSFWVEFQKAKIDKKEQAKSLKKKDAIKMPPLLEGAGGKKVLYIEDNDINLHLMEKVFLVHLKSVTLITAPDAEIGLEMAASEKPDLILMDINLPGMNGVEAFRQMQKTRSLHDIPVIAVSADAIEESIARTVRHGFAGYITKPFNVEELTSNIIGLLNQGKK